MCRGALLARPLSPLKAALGAALLHLGGVLPPQLGYSPSRKVIQRDWLWAVGGHALSWTSGSASFSALTVDALHRSYVLEGLDASVSAVNQGIAALQAIVPGPLEAEALIKRHVSSADMQWATDTPTDTALALGFCLHRGSW